MLLVTIIAHRGASAARRENTLEAFRDARQLGADWVELDVRRTADGALAVHHDAVVPGLGPLVELTARDLPEWLPLLDAALDACEGMGVNVEVKNLATDPDFDPNQSVARAVARLVAGREVIVSSFNLAAVDAVRGVDPSVPTAWLTLAAFDQPRAAATAAEHGHVALHPQHPGLTADVVAAVHELGLAVNTWTVDDPARMLELAAAGVDGIVTNVPDVAVATLR